MLLSALWASSVVMALPVSMCFRSLNYRDDQQILMVFGQNVWGNLGVGHSILDCPVTTSDGPAGSPCIPRPAGSFEAPEVALGATWSHVVSSGRLYSAGWAGDGACGFPPNVPTDGMSGEHVSYFVDVATRWKKQKHSSGFFAGLFNNGALEDACYGSEYELESASAAYTSSLLLSSNRRCVFTIGAVRDSPTKHFKIPRSYVEDGRTIRPVPVYHAPIETNALRVRQVVAAYGANHLVLESGDVLRAVPSYERWERVDGLANITKMQGSGWTQYGALDTSGNYFEFKDGQRPSLEMRNVTNFAVAPDHSLALREDGTLWVRGTGTCGRLGLGEEVNTAREFMQLNGSWQMMCAGLFFSLGVRANGDIYMWGSLSANTNVPGLTHGCDTEGKSYVSSPMPLAEFMAIWNHTKLEALSPISGIHCGLYHVAVTVPG